jgi:hypothetical protein
MFLTFAPLLCLRNVVINVSNLICGLCLRNVNICFYLYGLGITIYGMCAFFEHCLYQITLTGSLIKQIS